MKGHTEDYLGAAFRASLLAGNLILENVGKISGRDIDVKQASDFVTTIDRESERLIIETIRKKFPQHLFLAEESAGEFDNDESYRWIIDPLDGTTNFIHGYPAFSVSIALQYRNEIILGVVYDPLLNEIFTAEKDKGSYLNGRRIGVSDTGDMKNSLMATGFPFRKKEMIDAYLELFKSIFYEVSDIRRAGSAALDLAHLACGRCEGFFEIGLSPWDIAAGSLLITEAGGKISDFGGGTDYLRTGNVVAANSILHDDILHRVRGVFGEIIQS